MTQDKEAWHAQLNKMVEWRCRSGNFRLDERDFDYLNFLNFCWLLKLVSNFFECEVLFYLWLRFPNLLLYAVGLHVMRV